MIKIVPLESIAPSTYNPRTADPRRLDFVELSLKKLGWLLPIYASPDGEIVSGHQRHYIAARMGLSMVPVAYTKAMELSERKAVNVAFNRGTNDLKASQTPKDLTQALEESNVYGLAEALPDLAFHDPKFYRCQQAIDHPIQPLLAANRGRWNRYAKNISKTLAGKGVAMPIVCTPDLKVINGIGRLELAAERKQATVPVVFIDEAEAALCDRNTTVYALSSSDKDVGWIALNGACFLNERDSGEVCFKLSYEPGIRVGDIRSQVRERGCRVQGFKVILDPSKTGKCPAVIQGDTLYIRDKVIEYEIKDLTKPFLIKRKESES